MLPQVIDIPAQAKHLQDRLDGLRQVVVKRIAKKLRIRIRIDKLRSFETHESTAVIMKEAIAKEHRSFRWRFARFRSLISRRLFGR